MIYSLAFNNKIKKHYLNYLVVITIFIFFTACSKTSHNSTSNRRAPVENLSAQVNEIEKTKPDANNQQYYDKYRSNQDPYKDKNVRNYIDKYNLKAKRTPHENQILIGNIEDQNTQEKWVTKKKKASNHVLSNNATNHNVQNSSNNSKHKIEHDYSGPMAIFKKNKTKISENIDTSNLNAEIKNIAKPINYDKKKIVVKHNKDLLKNYPANTKKNKIAVQNLSGKPKIKKITFADDANSDHDMKAPENKTSKNTKNIDNPKPEAPAIDDVHHKGNKIKIDEKDQKSSKTSTIVIDNSAPAPATSNTKSTKAEEIKPIESKKDNSKASIANKITAAKQEIIKDSKEIMDKVIDHKKQNSNIIQPNQNEVVANQESTDLNKSKTIEPFKLAPKKDEAKPNHESFDKNKEKILVPQETSKQQNLVATPEDNVKISPPPPPQLPSVAPKQTNQSKLTDIPSVFSFVAIKKFIFYLKTTLLDFFGNIL